MRPIRQALFLLSAVCALAGGVAAQARDSASPSTFYLKDGDRVVFYGDSITEQRLYTSFVESYVVTRFPRLNVWFVHSGWGGDRVTGGGGGPIDLRLRRDVIAYRPTVMTIMLGMNDAGVRPYDAAVFNTYSAGYEHIISAVKGALPGLRITAIEPSPFDDVTRPPEFAGGYNAVLIRYGEFVKQLAEREHLTVAGMTTTECPRSRSSAIFSSGSAPASIAIRQSGRSLSTANPAFWTNHPCMVTSREALTPYTSTAP